MILNLIKPRGLTSHDVVNRVRKITKERRVGHGGTLDPLAEGVLIIGVGRESTKKLEEVLKGVDKEYEALIEFGKTSTTDDSEGKLTDTGASMELLTRDRLISALSSFEGESEQTPPAYSAVKILGKPAYKLARGGKKPILKARTVTIKEAELLLFEPPVVKIKFIVSSGTYIRSLARDLGEKLGVGAYLKELIRTRVGNYKIKDGTDLADLAHRLQIGNIKEK